MLQWVFCARDLVGLFAMQDPRWAGCYSRLAPEGLLCEIARGGGTMELCKKKRESRRGGGVRGCNILENGLGKFLP